MDKEMMEKLALLSALRNSRDDDDGDDIFVSSLRDAESLLQQHMSPSGAQFRRRLVAYITDPANRVMSECDIYHNFIMDLFRAGDHDLALDVCDFALEAAPYNRDMLGDAIKACGDSSQFEKGEEYLARAMEIPYHLWSFRLFLYSVDFLKTKLSAYPMDMELYQRSLDLADAYIFNLPFDEHGYNQKAELLVLMNERDKAISELKRYIFDTRPDVEDSRSELISAQCCVTLLNILDDSNDYNFIIKICDRGLRYTTQEQPSAAVGFFVYRKALALDAKVHSQNFESEVAIAEALKLYQSAYDLNQDRTYGRTIEKRYAVLRPHAKAKDFQPLVKRSLYVTEEQSSEVAIEK